MKQKNKLLFSGVLVLLLVTILSSVTVFAEATDSWTFKATLNIARKQHQVAVVNGKIYAIGGYAAGKALNTVEEYDPSANTWTMKKEMTYARYNHQVAVVKGKIYAIGGLEINGQGNSQITKTLEEYDPVTNVWTRKADMPDVKSDFQVAVLNDKIYTIGGNGSKTVDEYDPLTNIWTSKAPMSIAKINHRAIVVNDKIYVIGGSNSDGLNNRVEAYDSVSNTWTLKKSMLNKRINGEIAVVNGKIYALGGSAFTPNYQNSLTSIEEYDPGADSWTEKASMTNARDIFHVAVLNNKIYAIGGRNVVDGAVKNNLASVEEYDPSTDKCIEKSPLQTVRNMFDVGVLNNKVYAVGGIDSNAKELSSVEEYTAGGTTPIDPDPPVITGNSGILEITMTNGAIKEYDLTATELQSFLTWYDGRANGADKAYYIFTKKNNIKPFLSRKEYIAFDKISSFEVKEYTE